jgi:hypothetical protein
VIALKRPNAEERGHLDVPLGVLDHQLAGLDVERDVRVRDPDLEQVDGLDRPVERVDAAGSDLL